MSPECKHKRLWSLLLLGLPFVVTAQNEELIKLINPSFEDVPRAGLVGGQAPYGWYDCGAPGESAPDVQPGAFGITKPASNGLTYLGLVVRDNETTEAVGQRLSKPILANQCYEFNLDLARAELYLSPSRSTQDKVNFCTPAVLQVWGGNGYCDKAEKLYETTIIANSRWITTNIRMSPKKGNYTYILLSAYYQTPVLFPYNGNILIDNATPIKKLNCGPEKMPDPKKPTAKEVPKIKPNSTPPLATGQRPEPKEKTIKPAAQPMTGKIERKNVQKGKVFRLEKVYFDANKFEIKPESELELTELFDFLRENPDINVEVGGHTNNNMWPDETYAIELSTNRAKAVANWLIEKGIESDRIQYKGYGWTKPIDVNTSEAGKKRNQRVEVKILTING